jgi:hypothetical protein
MSITTDSLRMQHPGDSRSFSVGLSMSPVRLRILASSGGPLVLKSGQIVAVTQTTVRLAFKKRKWANDGELRRKGCCYPLRFDPKEAFKRDPGSGQNSG